MRRVSPWFLSFCPDSSRSRLILVYTSVCMLRPPPNHRLLTVCLVLLLLGAQFHFCNDFNPSTSGSHVCQLCATAGHAVTVESLSVGLTPAVRSLEVPCISVDAASFSFSSTSPRAPPSL